MKQGNEKQQPSTERTKIHHESTAEEFVSTKVLITFYTLSLFQLSSPMKIDRFASRV